MRGQEPDPAAASECGARAAAVTSLGTEGRSAALDRLRGAALLWVIVGHGLWIALGAGPWQSVADPVYGVSLFFAVSGALVGGSLLAAAGRPGSLRRFAIRRGARLLLPHLCALLAYLALVRLLPHRGWEIFAESSSELGRLVWSSTLLFDALPIARGVNQVVPGNWSISAEWLAALVLVPLLVRWAPGERRALASFLLLALLGGTLASLLGFRAGGYRFWAPLHAGSFAAGWWALRRAGSPGPLVARERLAIWATMLLLAPQALLVSSPALAGVVGGLLVRRALRAPSDRMGGSSIAARLAAALAWLGARSYGGYLGHFAGLTAGVALADALGSGPVGVIALSLSGGLAAGVLVAAPFARFVEAPAIRLGRRLAARIAG